MKIASEDLLKQLRKLRIKGILFYIIMLCEKVVKVHFTLKYRHFLCSKVVEKEWIRSECYTHISHPHVMHFISTGFPWKVFHK